MASVSIRIARRIGSVVLLMAGVNLVAGCDTRDFSDTRASIVVISATYGSMIDANGYALLIDGVQQATLAPSDTINFSRLEPGIYVLTLSDVAPNCIVHNSPQRQVNLRPGEQASILFEVSCTQQASNILFESDRANGLDLYALVFSSSSVTRLTSHPADDYSGAVSPDGRRIAFTSRRDGNMEIYLLNRVGGAPVNLTNHAADDYAPSFSPDGEWIAFVSNRGGTRSVYRMRVDGSDVRRITLDHFEKSDPVFLSTDAIVVASASNGSAVLSVVSVTGEVLYDLTPEGMDARSPAVSPDGRLVAFSGRMNGQRDIYVVSIDDRLIRRLTDDPAADDVPTFSLDGTRIAFASNRTGAFDVYIMTLDGDDVVNVTRSQEFDYGPSFLPEE